MSIFRSLRCHESRFRCSISGLPHGFLLDGFLYMNTPTRFVLKNVQLGSFSIRRVSSSSRMYESHCSTVGTAVLLKNFPQRFPSDYKMGGSRCYSKGLSDVLLEIEDGEIRNSLKDLLAVSWDDLPPAVVQDVKEALLKKSDEKKGQEILANVFRAAEAVEEFSGVLISMKMAIDDSIGPFGEDTKPVPEEFVAALRTAFDRYTTYLNSFREDEVFLRKKVETELGTRMIHLKMRCGGIGPDWGKITVLGTSGLAGSYIEHRAP